MELILRWSSQGMEGLPNEQNRWYFPANPTVINQTMDKIKETTYISNMKELKLQHLDRTISEDDTNLTTLYGVRANDRIIESLNSCSEDVESKYQSKGSFSSILNNEPSKDSVSKSKLEVTL